MTSREEGEQRLTSKVYIDDLAQDVSTGDDSAADDRGEIEPPVDRSISNTVTQSREEELENRSINQVFNLCTRGDLLSRPWFTRTWIVQEVMTARSLWIMKSNGNLLPWWPVGPAARTAVRLARSDAIPYVLRLEREHNRDYRLTQHPEDRPDLPRKPANFGHWKLWEMLEGTRDLQCEDARDKLYALLPLLVQPVPRLLRPDYSKSIGQVYADIAWFMIEYGVQDVLSTAGIALGGTDTVSYTHLTLPTKRIV